MKELIIENKKTIPFNKIQIFTSYNKNMKELIIENKKTIQFNKIQFLLSRIKI